MLKRTFTFTTAVLALAMGLALAAEPATQAPKEQVYGSQLMTRQDRVEYRTKMRAAKTAEEKAQIRVEHHERMKERATQQGVTLPDAPPAVGGGMGMGPGAGGGRNR
jgi:hypothetical protein